MKFGVSILKQCNLYIIRQKIKFGRKLGPEFKVPGGSDQKINAKF